MSFPENIINFFELDFFALNSEEYLKKIHSVYIGCKYCKEYIDRTSVFYLKNSKWVSKQPHLKGIRNGYRITAFLLPWKTGKEILNKYHKSKYIHQFYNEEMGFAYRSSDAGLSEDVFYRCEKRSLANVFKNIQNLTKVAIGVDWGMTSWVVIRAMGIPPETNKCHIVYVERIDKESLKEHGYRGDQSEHALRVEEIAKFFNAKIIINDANGIGVDRNSYLIRQFYGKAFGCFFDTDENRKQKMKTKTIEPQWTKDKVTISRVGTAKLMIQEFLSVDKEGKPKMFIPAVDDNIKEFIQHHLNIGVERMFDEKLGVEYEIVGSSGPDHYAFANMYSKIGFDEITKGDKRPLGII